jgi:hypothetical protein
MHWTLWKRLRKNGFIETAIFTVASFGAVDKVFVFPAVSKLSKVTSLFTF